MVIKVLPLIVIYFVAVAQVGCRCICNSVDTLCLYGCVKTTHGCIMDCKSPACLSQCIQTHWPGILDPEKEEEEEDESWSFNDNLVTVNQRSTPTIQNEPSDTVFTVHTTVIRLTTVTPIANTMSATSPAFKSNTVVSLGSKAIINPILAIICMTTVYLSIFGSRYVQINPFM